MSINRSGYYKWLNRQSKPSERMLQRESDISLIRDIHENHQSHGYRWIKAYLEHHYGVIMSNNHVHLCCKYAGIISQGRHYKYIKPGEEKKNYPNLVMSSWKSLSRPLEVVVSDTTCFYVKGKYYELTFYFDAFTKEILSYALATKRGDSKQYYDGLNDVLKLIKNEECTEPVILHTDQGSVYSSLSYNELISNYNIKRSMSRAGTPTDNPVNESLNGWIKEELILDFKLKESNDVGKTIKDYVHYYNNERPAYSLKYKTPIQFKSELRLNDSFL